MQKPIKVRLFAGLIILSLAMGACEKTATNPPAVGASRPWVAYEAAAGKTNATVHGPSREYLTPESEAIGRKFVKLDAAGQYVEIIAQKAANTIVVRYCIPDAPGGGGTDATLGLYLNGKLETKLPLTSRYSWIYGDFPWSNNPSKGRGHHFFDECHAFIKNVAPGDVIRLQKDADDKAGYYIIDLVELEQVAPPLQRPADSLSIVDFGAVPNDKKDASDALIHCMEAARTQKKSVWIPEGEFRLDGARIKVGDVRVQGAGLWYSILAGKSPMFEGSGTPVEFSNLAIFGDIDRRIDDNPENAFNGNFGKGSLFKNLWIEHFKCGFWTVQGTESMRVEGCRIRNIMADGLNFCDGTSYSVVEQCHLRNTGDDSLATWSPSGSWSSRKPCVQNRFVNNTIELPWHANAIGIYGGTDHLVARNKMTGMVYSGAGILVSSGFEAIPFKGTIRLEDNVIEDAGGNCYIGETVGGLWLQAKDSDIDALISVSGIHISGSPNSAITLHGPKKALRIEISDVEINGTGEYGIDVKSKSGGALQVTGLRISNSKLATLHDGSGGQCAIKIEETNAGHN
ncbi:MAG: glycosyl hydrolase family 28-related protein [Verrucomicrobiota bacterium]